MFTPDYNKELVSTWDREMAASRYRSNSPLWRIYCATYGIFFFSFLFVFVASTTFKVGVSETVLLRPAVAIPLISITLIGFVLGIVLFICLGAYGSSKKQHLMKYYEEEIKRSSRWLEKIKSWHKPATLEEKRAAWSMLPSSVRKELLTDCFKKVSKSFPSSDEEEERFTNEFLESLLLEELVFDKLPVWAQQAIPLRSAYYYREEETISSYRTKLEQLREA